MRPCLRMEPCTPASTYSGPFEFLHPPPRAEPCTPASTYSGPFEFLHPPPLLGRSPAPLLAPTLACLSSSIPSPGRTLHPCYPLGRLNPAPLLAPTLACLSSSFVCGLCLCCLFLSCGGACVCLIVIWACFCFSGFNSSTWPPPGRVI